MRSRNVQVTMTYPGHVKATPWATPARNPVSQQPTHPPAGRLETAEQGKKEYAGLQTLSQRTGHLPAKDKAIDGTPVGLRRDLPPCPAADFYGGTRMPLYPPGPCTYSVTSLAPTYHTNNTDQSPRTATTSPAASSTSHHSTPGRQHLVDRPSDPGMATRKRTKPGLESRPQAARQTDRPISASSRGVKTGTCPLRPRERF
ncbi:hypothetical protein JTB14_016562 [Gonioctena quinquepunctata]|nr:hypothetical protein JTB14_016562 [Gonioctena quinquepunctata]